nr:hypothetical protein [Tanacetum cinerariifolium]
MPISGDIFDDPSLLRFYQNDDTPPWRNIKRKEQEEDGPERTIRSRQSKTPEPKAQNFAIITRSGVSTQDPPFPAPSQSTSANHTKGKTKKKVLEIDEDELVPIILGRPFLALARVVIDVHEGKLSLRVKSKIVTFNIRKSMKPNHSCDDYLYCVDHTTKMIQEQWVDTTNRQVENINRAIKRILDRTIRNNRKDWSYKLDDALWAFQTSFKIPLGTTPFSIIYGKACYLPVELEHKAYWAIKNCKLDLMKARAN